MAAPGTIVLTGIAARGNHGVFDFERVEGQRFVVDLTCTIDLSAAADTDDLTKTVDYGALAQSVVDEITAPPLNLIETLADRIAQKCLRHPIIETVAVTVHKPDAPMPVEVADVAVTLTRSRNDQS